MIHPSVRQRTGDSIYSALSIMLSRANNDSGVVKLVGITYLLDKKLQIQLFSLRNKFSVKQTCIIRS